MKSSRAWLTEFETGYRFKEMIMDLLETIIVWGTDNKRNESAKMSKLRSFNKNNDCLKADGVEKEVSSYFVYINS